MEKIILPLFAVFGFLGSLFMDGGSESGNIHVTQTGKADLQGDS